MTSSEASALAGNRLVLQGLIEQREMIEAEVERLRAARIRVEQAAAEAAAVESEFLKAEAKHAEELRAWATGSDGEAPALPDAGGSLLPGRREAARVRLAAATGAANRFAAEVSALEGKRQVLGLRIEEAAAAIVADDAAELLSDLRFLTEQAARLAAELDAVDDLLVRLGHARGVEHEHVRRVLMQRAEQLRVERRAAQQLSPGNEHFAACRARWRALALALQDDPAATLDDVSEAPDGPDEAFEWGADGGANRDAIFSEAAASDGAALQFFNQPHEAAP